MKYPINGLFLASACGLFLILANPSKAAPVTLNSTVYDVGTFTPVVPANSILPTLEDQPWWGNAALAQSAADQIGLDFGYTWSDAYGPFFVYSDNGGQFDSAFAAQNYGGGAVVQVGINATIDAGFTYAVVPDSASTIALLGLGLTGLAGLRRRFARA